MYGPVTSRRCGATIEQRYHGHFPHAQTRVSRHLLSVLLALALPLAQLEAQRYLHWPVMQVDARLDSAGVLHVRERQTMAFTGDWNGGERSFNIRAGQRLTLHRLSRIDSTLGQPLAQLQEGDLSQVDQYSWSGKNVLRWRSRLPTDPPFTDTRLTYELEYSLGNVLVPRDSAYVLDHDFAFPDREGLIHRFTLALAIDPAWRAPGSFTGSYSADSIFPGNGYVVTVPLTYTRAGAPPGITFGAPRLMRLSLLALLWFGVALSAALLWRRERGLGRFAPLVPRERIDEAWLKQHVLHMLPEAVGAAWDNHTAGPEVAAVLARLVVEKKLSNEVQRVGWWIFTSDVLHLKLLVKRNQFKGHEHDLINALFEPGSSVTDTNSIRARYRKTGFDPASTIKTSLEAIVGKPNPDDPDAPKPSWIPTLLMVVAGFALLIAGGVTNSQDAPVVAFSFPTAFVFWAASASQAVFWRHRVWALGPHALRVLFPLGVMLGGLSLLLLRNPWRTGLLPLAGLAVLALAIVRSVFNIAKSRQGAERVALRKRLAAGREYFRYQLRQDKPALRDEWLPWLIAFELGPDMDKWFAAFGAAGTTAAMRSTSTSSFGSSSGGSSSSSTSWSGMGGGGGFSGGGSSASFASAVGVMAAGVSKPSSGSSSSGGSSGGGSSGGGGGGGW